MYFFVCVFKPLDTRGGIVLLPSIFKEKIENLIILGQVTWAKCSRHIRYNGLVWFDCIPDHFPFFFLPLSYRVSQTPPTQQFKWRLKIGELWLQWKLKVLSQLTGFECAPALVLRHSSLHSVCILFSTWNIHPTWKIPWPSSRGALPRYCWMERSFQRLWRVFLTCCTEQNATTASVYQVFAQNFYTYKTDSAHWTCTCPWT